ncbi:hypothetical protein GOZ97_12980 [Agrobacterium vitis]|uniref:GAD-like domain-containing protein n=1 Tax=Rhizobium/Agrobacterium group TaxID=227290 RepID=UPI0008DC073B|nr:MULTISPECIES: GAD-like domain-containing protein [Rhizobium/Agrobacterium group]MCF1436214.1 hypothetical protein [Allorhizobium ampelinum]MUO90603.1 hypothetical protein [Agrobacterium vitis]MUZ52478.1 hypothetical protein [Agrobacterium vitis]MUZ92335.1 hypothetical protein [Agrobacterium vitis]MVA42670.1 hypothetical protein [Agrobacterium vitis]
MSIEDFVAVRGVPRQARLVPQDEWQACEGRVPEPLIDFWKKNGVGYYANKNYWICTPIFFDSLLKDVLKDFSAHFAEDFSAFGYSSLGTIDLWHREGRHFTLSLDVGLVMDLTSRKRTDPPPYDLEDLYRVAGMQMPENAREIFLAGRDDPEDIGSILLSTTSQDDYSILEDDSGQPLLSQLRGLHGEPSDNEIYFRNSRAIPNLAENYSKVSIVEAAARIPKPLMYSYAVEVDGKQEIREENYP